ncbi:MAG: glycoside hydrolase family 125 protein [Mycobacteriaceae bacterium]|nr:glycoside hydrolase family 125 protein [Mycobacteriaceae bacterium]
MRESLPDGLAQLLDEMNRDLAGEPRLRELFGRTFTDTWRFAMRPNGPGKVFVSTGDIPAMWLRDSTAQVRPYLLAAADPEVAEALRGVLRSQVRYVLIDPYANAFNPEPSGAGGNGRDVPKPGPWVWERKYEVDSLAAVLQLAYGIWRATGALDHVDAEFRRAAHDIVELWTREQDHEDRSQYTFRRLGGPFSSDSLPRGGRGRRVAVTGMTWSGFRPSDDPCHFGYLVPANVLAAVALHGLAELIGAAGDPVLAGRAAALSGSIAAGVRRYGVLDAGAGAVHGYEVDGRCGRVLMDDANAPSLLSLPYLGWCAPDDPLYLRTRALVLSDANPYYYRGRAASGIGSPHTPRRHIWPLALAMQGLTSVDPGERARMAQSLAATDGGKGVMHESFHADDPSIYTREWFGWANALFSELLLTLTGRPLAPLLPRLDTTSA